MSRPIVLLGLVTAAALGLAAAYMWTSNGDAWKPPPGAGRELIDSRLNTANRDRVAICVDDAGSGSSESETKARVEIALIEVQRNPLWDDGRFGERDPLVRVGCPSPPLLLRPDTEVIQTGKDLGVQLSSSHRVVPEASYYLIFVFVIPRETIAKTFGESHQWVTEESLKFGDQLIGVTSGLYFSPDAINDREFLIDCLSRVLLLREAEGTTPCKERL